MEHSDLNQGYGNILRKLPEVLLQVGGQSLAVLHETLTGGVDRIYKIAGIRCQFLETLFGSFECLELDVSPHSSKKFPTHLRGL